MEELLRLRNYSPKTIKGYLFYVRQFLFFAKENTIAEKDEAVKKYLLHNVIIIINIKKYDGIWNWLGHDGRSWRIRLYHLNSGNG